MFSFMKKSLLVTAVLAFSTSAIASDSSEYVESIDYTIVSDVTTTSDTVVEYFSVYCPHCFAMERQGIPKLTEDLGADIEIVKAPVNFMGFIDKEKQNTMGKAFMAARNEGKADAFLKVAFPAYHMDKKDAPVDALAAALNVSVADATKLLESAELEDAFKKEMEYQSMLLKKGLKGTPAFIVNGKYLVNLSELNSADPLGDLSSLIKHLNKLD
ncbi:hypothetical protein BM525_21600 (plasmid) [Alteromonas mediterranea]|uniref:Thiol:disulfide interchange protein n=1 Tax=Alteromonas mediterranea TaxID=314275 RepID=A0AAC9JFZ5_9ALTE|nr:DsbA family protein [Alteromonas mediterranea]APD92457.1 hypothetical protein BM524_21380 [Alteromonas mediterranea]APE00318.1 hypothetical protein BM525_21600 [Alteromonas mediterranea]